MKKYLKLILFTIILFFVLICIFLNNFQLLNLSEVQAVEVASYEIGNLEKNQNPIKIDDILQTNTQDNIREEMIFEEVDLEHNTMYINNNKLPSRYNACNSNWTRWKTRCYNNKKI